MNAEAIISAAHASGCDAIHPGYGFLAECVDFAQACTDAGLIFVGPDVAHLDLFGDKARARDAARAANVPVLPGLDHAVTLDEARSFFASLRGGLMVIKAMAGGGGRGTRVVSTEDEVEPTFQRCQSEAHTAFGCSASHGRRWSARSIACAGASRPGGCSTTASSRVSRSPAPPSKS
jgi:acetyl/propionyl-CoA carboxylase alpha subunit